jgi:hypothetical protein
MKTRQFPILVAVSALFAITGSNALANDKWLGNRGDNWEEHIVSTKTRAQVIAELNEARSQGLVGYGEEPGYPKTPIGKSTRSRDEVRAEAIEATKNKTRNLDYIGGQ